MISANRLKYLYLAYLSAPACDRQLYRLIRRRQIRNIVEIGIGQARRAQRMIAVAQSTPAACPARFTAIDLFESRGTPEQPGLTLKQAYRQLKATQAKVQVVPGDPRAALARVANTLMGTDLLVISADQDAESLSQAWFYVPRMLHAKSLVFIEEQQSGGKARSLRLVSADEIRTLAAAHVSHRRAA
jgi:hypothetical protein